MKYIGLDLGSKTLGVAISDELGIIARNYDTFRFQDDDYDKVHYIYLCKKLKGADDASKYFFEETLKELELQEKLEEEMINHYEKNI